MRRKGFTLIELLAVIVILAIIALISTPIIIGVIDKARKGAFEDSAYGVLDASKLYVINKIADENAFTGETFDFSDNVDHLKLSGDKPYGGKLILDTDGKQGLAIWDKDKRWCAYKDYTDEKITIKDYKEEECIMKSNTGSGMIIDKNTDGNTDGLFTDDFGNTRYRGNNTVVKNYVTYNNEEWRIIGVFDGKIKLVKADSVENKQWHSALVNNWATSDIQIYLNGEYHDGLTSQAKNMIEDTKYYLGGHSTTDISKKEMYEYERGTTVYTGNPTDWTGKIGLMYPSDYGYASGDACTGNLNSYNNTNCTSNNWLYKGAIEWLITPRSNSFFYAFYVYSAGHVYNGYAVTESHVVHPVLYLKSNIKITGGDGTQASPYTLS